MKRKFSVAFSVWALLLFLVVGFADAAQVSLIYTTDAHGHVVTDERTIGLDVVAAIAHSVPDSILLDVGDFSHGLPIATISKGRDIVTLMKRAGYEGVAIGNHEFNYGAATLTEMRKRAEGEPYSMFLLSANIFAGDGTPFFTPWAIIERGGFKVGVFGITTVAAAQHMGARDIPGISFEDYAEASRRAVRKLRSRGADLIVAMTHIETYESRRLASEVGGIDVMLCGHSHVTVDETVNGTRLCSSGAHGLNVGILELTSDESGAISSRNVLLDRATADAYEPDPFVRILTETVTDALEKDLAVVVGNSGAALDGERETVRVSGSNLGDMIADAMIAATGADIAIINGGAIRDSIPAGVITRKQVVTVFPFDNTIITKIVTGAQIKDILEKGLSALPGPSGGFPQIGGMRVTADPSAEPGKRVVSITGADGKPLEDDAKYELATNDFLAGGGDGYPHLASLPVENRAGSLSEAFLVLLEGTAASKYDNIKSLRIEMLKK